MLCFKDIHLLPATIKKAKVSYQFNKQACFASKTFTYFLQPSRRPRSVINSTSRHALLQRHSLTLCNHQEGQVSYQFTKQTCFTLKASTYIMQTSIKPRSVINST